MDAAKVIYKDYPAILKVLNNAINQGGMYVIEFFMEPAYVPKFMVPLFENGPFYVPQGA
jgi:hypothetical protein